ncbi:hypothetical protein E4U42_001567 [Claviceps africana]|uniref:Rhamnogalacturonase A/B/Epimerase-like pectate lyase domain-containing protein n=1 Tax=Claviceps africana TaxID=83212 RepID=A0A8K0NK18_9HYPO|nr:hypothetical protein E4U42_001567 [Claviceps africana]
MPVRGKAGVAGVAEESHDTIIHTALSTFAPDGHIHNFRISSTLKLDVADMVRASTVLTALMASVAVARNAKAPQIQNTSFWYPLMDHERNARGYVPDIWNDFEYNVYQVINEKQAKDAREAIQWAIDVDGHWNERKYNWFASQVKVVYFPPGTYQISSQILMRAGTVLMGDPTNPPTIIATKDFRGPPQLIKGLDEIHIRGGRGGYAIALKNLIFDTTNIDANRDFRALDWRVAQGSHMQNVRIVMPPAGNESGHTGVWLGPGTSLSLSDVRIERGWNINFYQNKHGMWIRGGAAVTITASTFDSVGSAVVHTEGSTWIALIDCRSVDSGVTFQTSQRPSLLIENLSKDTNSDIVVWNKNETVLAGGSAHIDQFTYANTYGRRPVYGPTFDGASHRPRALVRNGRYPSIVAPDYRDTILGDFINVMDKKQNGGYHVHGDHRVDEARVLNKILARAARLNKIAYFPWAKYRVDSTLYVPPGTRIVGEAWATILGKGHYFKNESDPKPVVMVGKKGSRGIAHIQDMRITVERPLPGAILLQVNMAGDNPGDVAIWNSHITVGGTAIYEWYLPTRPFDDHCSDPEKECKAAYIGLHLTETSSAYVENTWVWVADDKYEGKAGFNIAAKGGILIQATNGTWLHGVGAEHWWLYQFNFWEARNVFASMLEAETNHDQGAEAKQLAPTPWVPNAKDWNDPDFSWCEEGDGYCRKGLSTFITGGHGIRHYASAAWDFFRGAGQNPCDVKNPDPYTCINIMHWIDKMPCDFQMFGICSKSSANALRLANGTMVPSRPDFVGGWANGGASLGVFKHEQDDE